MHKSHGRCWRNKIAQLSGLDDFVNGGPLSFPMVDLSGLIDDTRHKKPLDLVTITGRWNFNHDGKFGYNNKGGTNTWQGKQGRGAKIPTNVGQLGGGGGG